MTEEQCVTIGGHCFVQDPYAVTQAGGINPKTFYKRTCSHCGKTEKGTSQPSIKWETSEYEQRLLGT
jgi:hypothetical protein